MCKDNIIKENENIEESTTAENIEENTNSEEVEEDKKFEPIVFINNPISNTNEDVIGFESQVETLMCAIENNANMIGIIADYGTGKSSMTELLTKRIEVTNKNKPTNKPIKINMWDCLSKVLGEGKEPEGTRVDKLVKLICKNEEELNSGLTEKQKEIFEKFKDCTSELSCITEREAFSAGFILATRIMAEVMQGLEQVEDI